MSDENFDDLYGSQYLAATDLKKPFTSTIEDIEQQDFAKQGERQRMKAVLHLKGVRKPIVCNKTNAISLAEAYGKDFDDWKGKRVKVQAERTSFNGKPVMGLRLYPADEEKPKAVSKSSEIFNDEIEF
jgi:hypothetical protein